MGISLILFCNHYLSVKIPILMTDLILISGAFLGALAVILGAFGAHSLKNIFPEDLQKSFETGVKYQMYHSLLLLFLGSYLEFNSGIETAIAVCITIGTFFFSFSIYGLCLSSYKGRKLKFLGPITPLGGVLLVIGWILLLFLFLQKS